MYQLYVLISGFGLPHWEHKVSILRNNLQKICSYSWKKITIQLCQYSDKEQYRIPEDILQEFPMLEVIYEQGIVGQFIKRHAVPQKLKEYDYVMILLDDVELINLDFKKIIRYQQELKLDIVSPCLTLDSKHQYKYMLEEPFQFDIKIANVCEYFCLFFPRESFSTYYDHIADENPWMWGLDLILVRKLKMHIGLLNYMVMKHWYKSESYASYPEINPLECFERYLAKYGENKEELAQQVALKYYVVDYERLLANRTS